MAALIFDKIDALKLFVNVSANVSESPEELVDVLPDEDCTLFNSAVKLSDDVEESVEPDVKLDNKLDASVPLVPFNKLAYKLDVSEELVPDNNPVRPLVDVVELLDNILNSELASILEVPFVLETALIKELVSLDEELPIAFDNKLLNKSDDDVLELDDEPFADDVPNKLLIELIDEISIAIWFFTSLNMKILNFTITNKSAASNISH